MTTKEKTIKDTATCEKNVKRVIVLANKLIVKRELFETEELARSNKALYSILTEVYKIFETAIATKCMKETITTMRAELTKRGVRVQANTQALTVIVRYIFNSDRKRAYNYASTLMAAVQAGIKPVDLSAFIERGNGVEECKKEYKKKDETKESEAAIKSASLEVIDTLSSMSAITTVKLPNASVDLQDGQFAFIIARQNSKGEFELLRVVPKSTKGMQNSAIKELAKVFIESKNQAIAMGKKAKSVQATEKAIKSMTSKEAANMTVKDLELAGI